MGSQTLQTWIAINAKIGNGFSQVGATLTELGSIVDGMSQKLLNFGKESLEVYKDYEKSMSEAEIALSTSYGQNTKELSKAMDQLNAKATEWAATTIFHTDDVAAAINQAAHAGWDLDEILNGMPVAMRLAQAGSMDLSEALTYITKSMRAFDVSYDELGEFVDMWVYAANSSTGDVKDFGDAMKKMGATMRFTDSKEELFALIGLMHDMGESGSTAATLLRTSMMRLIAPSGVASKVMEQLGATDEEIREIREDASKLAALNTLEEHGFTAFQDNGQAKPILEMYADLGEVLAEIAGGYENITKNQTTAGILGTIFGTRGITGALDIVNGLQRAQQLYKELREGAAEGYGQYAQDVMMDTLYGKTEMFESKVERLKQVVGETLSGNVESFYAGFGKVVDSIAGLDEGKMDALVSGLSVIAAAGPGLLTAGAFFRFLGLVLNPVTGVGLGLVALTAAASAIEKLHQADLRDTFGDMEMDTEGITTYVHTLSEDFRQAYTYTDQFQQALGKAVANYRDASGTFSTNLFSAMIQNAELTPDDLKNLMGMADKMQEYAQEALFSASSGDTEYWVALFGGEEAVQNDPILQSIIEKTNQAYENSKSEIGAIGKGLRETLINAYTNDNQIDETEYNKILEWFRKYNAAVAEAAAQAQEEEQQITMQKWLLQAQTGDFDDINTLARTAAAERDELLQKETDQWLDKKARLMRAGGTETEIAEGDRRHEQRMNEIRTRWDQFQLTLYESQLQNNGQMENWAALQNLAGQYLSGSLSSDEALNAARGLFGGSAYSGDAWALETGNTRSQLAKITGYMLTALGGEDEVKRKIDLYNKEGNKEMADRLTNLYAMTEIANGFMSIWRTEPVDLFGWNIDALGDYGTVALNTDADKAAFEKNYTDRELYLAQQRVTELEAQIARSEGLLNGTEQRPAGWYLTRGEEQEKIKLYGSNVLGEYQGGGLYDQLAEAREIVNDMLAARVQQEAGEASAQAAAAPGGEVSAPEKVQIEPMITGEGAQDALTQLEEQGVEVKVSGDTTELTATIDAEDGRDLMTYINGDATDLHAKIMDEDGQTITTIVNGDVSSLAAAIESQNGKKITVYVESKKLAAEYAEGGRATEASIFGEAGPEWAIPEKHDQRTAELLNAAREASGFTWPELIAQFGGLNANTERQPTTIVYSPTINAQNAEGVEQALMEDRRRFEKWFEDKQMRDAAEVYA